MNEFNLSENVWQKLYDLCLKAYRIAAKFLKDERFGLTSQIRRSAVSISIYIELANISADDLFVLCFDPEEYRPHIFFLILLRH